MKKALSVLLCLTFVTALAESAIVNTNSSPLTMRDKPDQKGKEICEIPKSATVTVLEKGS